MTAKEHGFLCCGDDNVLKLTVVRAAHICKYTKYDWITYFKWMTVQYVNYTSTRSLLNKIREEGTQLMRRVGRIWLFHCSPYGYESSRSFLGKISCQRCLFSSKMMSHSWALEAGRCYFTNPVISFSFFFFFLSFCHFQGRFLRHMEVPRLGVESEQ